VLAEIIDKKKSFSIRKPKRKKKKSGKFQPNLL